VIGNKTISESTKCLLTGSTTIY